MLVLTERSRRMTVAERAIFAGFLLTLALVPLPFGADRPWAWSLLAAAIGILLLSWGVLAAHSRSYRAASIRPLLPAVGLFVLVVLWAAVQASGLVPPEWRHPLWPAAEAALGRPLAGGVSLDDHGTWTATMRLMCYGGVFLLSFQLCISLNRSERLIRLLIAMAMVYACYGLFAQSAGTDRVLWYAKDGTAGRLSSTFLDADAFAAYAGLGLLSALAILSRPALRKGDLSSNWRFATRAFADYFFARTWTMLLGVAALFGALLMTQSRVGLAAVLLGAGAYLAVMAWVRRGRAAACVAVAVMGVAVSSLVALAGGPGAAPGMAAERADAYARTVNAIAAEPLRGTGYGTHHRILGMLPAGPAENAARPVENAFLEYALEIGIPATAALLLAVGWIVLLCFSSVLRHRRAAYLPCLGVAATVLVGALGAVDQGVQIPAVAATYAAILGAACAHAFRLEIPERRTGERRAA